MNQSADWLTAFEALKSVYSDGAYSNMALNKAIPRHRDCRDSFVRNLVKETIRQTVTLDFIIDRLASNGIKGIRIRTLIILRMGLCAVREMDSVPDHAAVNEAVALARKTARGTDGFVNAVLRSYLRRRSEFESESGDPPFIDEITDIRRKLSVRYSMPEELTDLICTQYGKEAEAVLRGLNTPPELVLRVNTLRTSREAVISGLRSAGFEAAPAAESVRAVIVRGSGIIESDIYRQGIVSVQSLSSILAVEALSPEPDDTVLDMCAAPGGKSAMMAEMMSGRGGITACDIHEHRLDLIRASAKRTGAEMIETRLSDGTVYDDTLRDTYDCVLADVPCSGLGVMSTKPEIRLRTGTDELNGLPDIQLAILENAFRYTKPGGRICYSTCTLNKRENEDVVTAFMKRHSEAGDDGAGFPRIIEMNTFLPYNNLIGFYYCIIEKNV